MSSFNSSASTSLYSLLLVPVLFFLAIIFPSAILASTQVTVSATNCSWQSTNVTVHAGDVLTVTASGCAYFASSSYPDNAFNPDGYRCTNGQPNNERPEELCPSARACSLIGRIGSGSCFFVGTNLTITASSSGTLYLGVNDLPSLNGCIDNSGSWTATISFVSQVPALEVVSAAFDNSLYGPGEVAILHILIKSNWAAGQYTVNSALAPPMSSAYDLTPQAVTLTPGTTTQVDVSWTVPSVAANAALDARVTIGSITSSFPSATWIAPASQSERDAAVQQATNCTSSSGWIACGLQVTSGAIQWLAPGAGSYASIPFDLASVTSLECMSRRYENTPGRERQAAAMRLVQGLGYGSWATQVVNAGVDAGWLTLHGLTGKVFQRLCAVPACISAGITCASALTDWCHLNEPSGSWWTCGQASPALSLRTSSTSGPPPAFADTLATALDLASDSSGVQCSSLVLVTGACALRIEADSTYATSDSTGLIGAVVFDLTTSNTRGAWIGASTYRFGHSPANNPTSAATIRAHATAHDSLEVAVLHRDALGTRQILKYAAVAVDSGAVVTIPVSSDSTRYPVYLDADHNGTYDWICYPGGAVLAVPDPAAAPPDGLLTLDAAPNPTRGQVRFLIQAGRPLWNSELRIYDLAGRRIQTLKIDGILRGRQQIAWDCRTSDGRSAPAGVYFCRLVSEHGTSSPRRLILVQ